MTETYIKKVTKINGTLNLSGDKSITHRAIILGSIAQGTTNIDNFSISNDCAVTIKVFRDLGVIIESSDKTLSVHGKGLYGLKPPNNELYMEASGTSMRLLAGILSGQNFKSVLKGDESLSKRPMKRITEPLKLMGAEITGPDDANFAPLYIKGGNLKNINYSTKISSAQVKSAILLAGLYAGDITCVTEPEKSRDHTERMLKLFGAKITETGLSVSVEGKPNLAAKSITVPGDISSAAFFIVAATIVKNSKLLIKSVSLNPTRTGIIDIIQKMGGDIKEVKRIEGFEPSGDILIKSAKLRGVTIEKNDIPRLIDELPVIMVAASLAEGTTIIKSAGELRVKETDRINSMVTNLKALGVDISPRGEDIIIKGGGSIRGGNVMSFSDHRTALSLVIAGLVADKDIILDDIDCIAKSFPDFFKKLETII